MLFDANGKPILRSIMVRNPMLDYPRMLPCWCGSGKKAKKCCLPKMKREIPEKDAKVGQDYIAYVREQLDIQKDWQPTRVTRH